MTSDCAITANSKYSSDSKIVRLFKVKSHGLTQYVIEFALNEQNFLFYFGRFCSQPISVRGMSVSSEVGCVPEAMEQGRIFCKVGFCVSCK